MGLRLWASPSGFAFGLRLRARPTPRLDAEPVDGACGGSRMPHKTPTAHRGRINDETTPPCGVLEGFLLHLLRSTSPTHGGRLSFGSVVNVLWQVPPPIYERKENHKHPGPAAPYDAIPPAVLVLPRIFPHDVSRTERGFLRARRRPGLPRGQFSGPWLFSTAEARASNSSPSSDKRHGPRSVLSSFSLSEKSKPPTSTKKQPP